tara:strand:- start:753 stop:5516 length:4764 start_codon:yes stop_codon:yes gene_type:complete
MENNFNESEIPWILIESYFKNQHLKQLVRHQLESYNHFVNNQIENTIDMFNPVRICSEHDYIKEHNLHRLEIFITFENFNIHRPQIYENNGATKIMFPQEARLRNFTYAGSMTIDLNIKYIVRNGENYKNILTYKKKIKDIHIGKLPIMLKSDICVLNQYQHLNHDQTGECKMDPGGYFIINGSEKTCLGQERAAENQIYCFNIKKNNTRWSWVAEMKCIPDWKCISPKQINLMISGKNNGFGNAIYIQIPRLKNPIPLFIIFRAFNVISDKAICEKILLNTEEKNLKKMMYALKASIVDANTYLTYDSAVRYIVSNVIYTPINVDKETGAKKKYDFALEVISNDLFPHCKTNTQKIYMLGYMTNILLQTSFGWLKESDRDSYLNKRIDLTGSLLNNLLRNYFNKLVKDMQKQIVREINTGSWKSNEDYLSIINLTNIYKIIKSTTIENGIKRALATGDFGIKQINSNKVGVAQVLNRLTYISSLSHLRRINTPIDKSGKLIPPRRLHNSSWGCLCPAECFDPETLILMWNGTFKRADNINIGDILIDDTGYPTKIRSICSGQKNMYDIIPEKNNFIKHRVTDNHILTLHIRQHKNIHRNNIKDRPERFIVKFLDRSVLKIKEKSFESLIEAENFVKKFTDDDTIDITIEEYLKLNKNTRKHLVLFKTCEINWEKKDIIMDPYLLGMWLGDGLSNGTGFALNYKTDFETLEYWEKWAENNGAIITKDKRYKYSIVSKKNKASAESGLCNRVEKAPLKKYLQIYNLINNKHIPNEYLTNDRETRLKVLAGLIDTDGNVRANGKEIRICQGPNNYRIIDDAYTLTMSLGFSCRVKEGRSQWTDYKSGNKCFSSYKELTITGSNIYEIPTLLPRKKLNKTTDSTQLLRSNEFKGSLFKLEEVGIGKYVGWQLEDKRGRFLLSDGIVVHNTPEGASVGIVKNLSYMTHVTTPSNSTGLYDYILPLIISIDNFDNSSNELFDKVKIFINGCWVGISEDPVNLYENLKEKKYKGIINIYTSIVFDYNMKEIKVRNDAGRLSRPLLKVKNNKVLYNNKIINDIQNNNLNWNDLLVSTVLDNSIIEYLDSYEQNSFMIAMEPDLLKSHNSDNRFIYKFTHCEIHPSTIFGILASCIPFPENNQSPRNTYQSAMGKQAIGMYVTNYDNRMDKTAYVLSYPMRPLVDTRLMNIIKLNNIPSGEQVIVAIGSHTGYNQEDSILFNQGAIDRGLFLATIYHTEKDEDKKLYGNEEIRCKPDKTKTKNMKFANYDKINNNGGIIPENTLVEDRDVIIAKVLPIKENKNDYTKTIKYQDESHVYRTNEETYIDKNYIECNGDGYNFCKVRLRNYRKPVIGDKFSSRHGQKGTIGNVIPEENMPFTADGLKPDIIINPHAIPSRMTIAQLKETLLGKVLVQLGLFGDGTSFSKFKIDDITNELQNHGYESNGNEIMYNALTGEQLSMNIFIGPAFYQRLKHMVNDKQHSRSIGPMVNLTRQPAEGRARDGGLRFGEMERDCMISHGASRFTKGRLYDASDAFSVNVCNKCGLIASYNNIENIHICNTCENRTDFRYVEIPYACKLMFQELLTMNIAPRIMCE